MSSHYTWRHYANKRFEDLAHKSTGDYRPQLSKPARRHPKKLDIFPTLSTCIFIELGQLHIIHRRIIGLIGGKTQKNDFTSIDKSDKTFFRPRKSYNSISRKLAVLASISGFSFCAARSAAIAASVMFFNCLDRGESG